MVADAVGFDILGVHPGAGDFHAEGDGFHHGAVAEAAAAHVVDFAGAGSDGEALESGDEVGGVDVVAHLLALVAEDVVGAARHSALHQVGQEAVQLGAAVAGSGKLTTTEDAGVHAKRGVDCRYRTKMSAWIPIRKRGRIGIDPRFALKQ